MQVRIIVLLINLISLPLCAMEQATIQDSDTTDEEKQVASTFDTTWLREFTGKKIPKTIIDTQQKERIIQEAITYYLDNKDTQKNETKETLNYQALTNLLSSVNSHQDTYTSLEKDARRNIKIDIHSLIAQAIAQLGQQDTNDALSKARKQKIQKWIFAGATVVATLVALVGPSVLGSVCPELAH